MRHLHLEASSRKNQLREGYNAFHLKPNVRKTESTLEDQMITEECHEQRGFPRASLTDNQVDAPSFEQYFIFNAQSEAAPAWARCDRFRFVTF